MTRLAVFPLAALIFTFGSLASVGPSAAPASGGPKGSPTGFGRAQSARVVVVESAFSVVISTDPYCDSLAEKITELERCLFDCEHGTKHCTDEVEADLARRIAMLKSEYNGTCVDTGSGRAEDRS